MISDKFIDFVTDKCNLHILINIYNGEYGDFPCDNYDIIINSLDCIDCSIAYRHDNGKYWIIDTNLNSLTCLTSLANIMKNTCSKMIFNYSSAKFIDWTSKHLSLIHNFFSIGGVLFIDMECYDNDICRHDILAKECYDYFITVPNNHNGIPDYYDYLEHNIELLINSNFNAAYVKKLYPLFDNYEYNKKLMYIIAISH